MRGLPLALLLAAALLAPPAASGLGQLDQQQTTTANDITVGAGIRRAQVFKAGKTGALSEVEVFIKQLNAPAQPLTVAIWNAAGSPPVPTTAIPMASVDVPAASVPTTEQFVLVSFPLAAQASVTTGQLYAIVLSTTEAAGGVYLWYGVPLPANPYVDGSGFYSDMGGAWAADGNVEDFAFKTYVTVPAAVTFRGGSAVRTSRGVLVRWRTASELGTLGFHVYRQMNGRRVRASSWLIPAKGGGLYSFLDRRAPRGKALRYWIKAIDLNGSSRWYAVNQR